jgi:hypothetical protein
MRRRSDSSPLQEESRKALRVFLHFSSRRSNQIFDVLTHDPIVLFHFQVCVRLLAQETESGDTSSTENMLVHLGTVLDQNLIGG